MFVSLLKVAGCRPRENIDGVPHQCSRADSRLLRGISTGECAVALTTLSPALPNRFLQLPWWEGCTLDEWRSWRVLACVRRVQRAWQVPKAAKPHPTDALLGDGLMGCFTPLSKVMGGDDAVRQRPLGAVVCNLLPAASADARSSDDDIAFEGPYYLDDKYVLWMGRHLRCSVI